MQVKYYLNRFVYAQDDGTKGSTYEQALEEIRNGAKHSHWVWYVFPQIKGIPGTHSGNALLYALSGKDEAKAYWVHPVLGQRMREILAALLQHKDKSIISIMGSEIDARKLRSSMTLFYYATQEPLFKEVLDTFFFGAFDDVTNRLLANA